VFDVVVVVLWVGAVAESCVVVVLWVVCDCAMADTDNAEARMAPVKTAPSFLVNIDFRLLKVLCFATSKSTTGIKMRQGACFAVFKVSEALFAIRKFRKRQATNWLALRFFPRLFGQLYTEPKRDNFSGLCKAELTRNAYGRPEVSV
jgi:hypothetical protein